MNRDKIEINFIYLRLKLIYTRVVLTQPNN